VSCRPAMQLLLAGSRLVWEIQRAALLWPRGALAGPTASVTNAVSWAESAGRVPAAARAAVLLHRLSRHACAVALALSARDATSLHRLLPVTTPTGPPPHAGPFYANGGPHAIPRTPTAARPQRAPHRDACVFWVNRAAQVFTHYATGDGRHTAAETGDGYLPSRSAAFLDARAARVAAAAANETPATANLRVRALLQRNEADYNRIDGQQVTQSVAVAHALCPAHLPQPDFPQALPVNPRAGERLTVPQAGSAEMVLLAFMLEHDTSAINLAAWRELRDLWALAGAEVEPCGCGRCASLAGCCWQHVLQIQCPLGAGRMPSCNEAQGNFAGSRVCCSHHPIPVSAFTPRVFHAFC
jgi:hypothetical protein